MGKTDTVLFDFDGTLIDTNQIIVDSWQHTFRTLQGREHPLKEIYATFGEPLLDTMARYFPDMEPEDAASVYRTYMHARYVDAIRIFPGMAELVRELSRRGYKLGIVTSRILKSTMQGLVKYGIEDCFDCIVTCEDTDKHKPDPEPALIALRKLGAVPENAVMLGDSIYDIQCAQNAGIRAVLVSWALAAGAQDMAGTEPDAVIQHAEELLDIL